MYDRQEIITNVAGFFAPSHRELSEALTIIGTKDSIGIGQHFDEIYRRQQINRVNKPENAIMAVTKEYIANFRSSEAIAKQLGAFALDISEIFNPAIAVGEEINHIKTGHRAFIKYTDLKVAYSNREDIEGQKFSLEYPYFTKDNSVREYVHERLSQIKVKDARKLVAESIEDQKNRGYFWLDVVKLLRTHRIAGPIVKAALLVK